jgi:dolichyl-phosphate beta-glucosyltransferase
MVIKERVLVIIPVYNGASSLPRTRELVRELCARIENARVVFVNDGSTDGTGALLRSYYGENEVITLSTNQGKGYAIREGVRKYGKDTDLICFTDVDIPYGIEALERVVVAAKTTGIAVGSRSRVKSQKQYSWYRYLMSRVFRWWIPREIRGVRDTQCGLKAFRGSIAVEIFESLSTFRWAFDLEIFVIAKKRGFPYIEVPVELSRQTVQSSTVLSFWKDGVGILKDVYTIRKNISNHRYEQ